jgi:glutamine amidotransferase-like uncharacterized protein
MNRVCPIKASIIIITIIMTASVSSLFSQGYYKDIYMDGGIKLTSRQDLPAARRLDMSIEHFVTGNDTPDSPLTLLDTIMQQKLFSGCETDLNGVLLYPDGAPRFRMIYVNGGKATPHGKSLAEKGRTNIQNFVNSGGSYVGTCAGMFLASYALAGSKDSIKPNPSYLGIWPGIAHSTKLIKSSTGLFIEKGAAILKYYNYGGDMYVDSVRHNGGGFAYDAKALPKGTEILMRYDYEPLTAKDLSIHKKISSWAWKQNENTGRVVLIGSHPEGFTSGERLDLMSALIQYAVDGCGAPKTKGELFNGILREMVKSTKDNDPDYTMIGDRQYHHFTVTIPKNARNIKVKLNGPDIYNLNLYLRKEALAYKQYADYMDISLGAQKEISLDHLDSCKWNIAVECASTVDVVHSQWGELYTGNLSVLNGVPYSIIISWE